MARDQQLEDMTRRIDQLTFRRGPVPSVGATRFQRILVAYDGSATAEDGLLWAMWIAKLHKAQVTAVLVLPSTPEIWSGELTGISPVAESRIEAVLAEEERHAGELLAQARERLSKAGLRHESHLLHGNPADEIARLAEQEQTDLVIVGPRSDRSAAHFFLGSVADAVKDRVPASVLIARGPPPPHELLVAVDRSSSARRAGAVAADLLPHVAGGARVIHVMPTPFAGFTRASGELAEQTFADIARNVRATVGTEDTRVRYDIAHGRPAERVLEEIEKSRPGLVVLGALGVSGLRGLFLGSVSNRVAHQARSSVLIVKGADME
jgi:universal stress protein E